jgi:hypothetical protein
MSLTQIPHLLCKNTRLILPADDYDVIGDGSMKGSEDIFFNKSKQDEPADALPSRPVRPDG